MEAKFTEEEKNTLVLAYKMAKPFVYFRGKYLFKKKKKKGRSVIDNTRTGPTLYELKTTQLQ